LITSRFSVFFSSAAFVKLKDPAMAIDDHHIAMCNGMLGINEGLAPSID
jgi:hypothetical protein